MAEQDIEDQDHRSPAALPGRYARRESSQFHLAKALLESAVGTDVISGWSAGNGLCVVIETPSAEWVAPIEHYVKSLANWGLRHTRTSKSRSSEDVILTQVVETLALGEKVLGISQNTAHFLPAAMIASADQTIALTPPTAKVVASAIKAVTGKVPKGLSDKVLAGLDFSELASCIRKNSTLR